MSVRTPGTRARFRVSWGLSPLLALIALFGARTAHAYRPFDGTDGDVADVGEFELELGPLHYAQEGDEKFFLTPTVLNLGIVPRMELVLDFVPVYPQAGGPTQVTDTDVFAKFLLRKGALQEESGPSIAVEAGPLIPEVNGQKGFGASANLILSERWGGLTLHLNNGAQLSRSELDFSYAPSLIGEFELGAPVRPVVELSFETEPKAGSNTYSVLGGAIWGVSEGFDLDAAAVFASVDGTAAYEIRLGLTWAVEVWTPAGGADGAVETTATR